MKFPYKKPNRRNKEEEKKIHSNMIWSKELELKALTKYLGLYRSI